jgi:hypothetical protein
MILTDREIQIAIEAGSIVIEPVPGEQAYSSTSVDLTLDEVVSEYRPGAKGLERIADPSARDYDHEEAARELLTEVVIDKRKGWVFEPDRLVLAWTKCPPSALTGQRAHKLHQWLTEDVGDPMLAQHLHSLVMFQRFAIANGHGWKRFLHTIDQVMPKRGETLELPLNFPEPSEP